MVSYGPCKLPRKRRSKTEIAEAQAEPEEAPDPSQPPEHKYALPELGCMLVKIGNGLRRQCQLKHPVSQRSTWECSRCKVTLCAVCFVPYHKDKNLM
ncbi:hypothetical protein ElyMa_004327500 [Elysia marginata]|uniref:B box-type domain-containing protein n=1 Tax=Elysia marginata TaxID=1093978 RepID=A0AAV4H4E2_9GAST|nr:hypothetical protein ElyMa_004327500 [Elysia marginata]